MNFLKKLVKFTSNYSKKFLGRKVDKPDSF